MKRILFLLVGVCALGGTVFTFGCGPGLVAAGGGSVGAIFGISSGDDGKKSGGGGSTTPTTNVVPAVIVTSLAREESPATISYTILDANNDPCSVDVQYSVGGGAFSACFEGGGDGTTGLSSSAGGTPHVFDWDFAADLTPGVTQDITIRIRADDGQGPGSWAMLTNQTVGNEAPVISNVQATGTDVVLLTFDLTDATSDLATIDVEYSFDQGQNFIAVDTDPMSATYELIGNPPTDMLTSPTGSPGQFIWASALALSDFVGDVLIRLTPRDLPSGYSSETFGAPVVVGPFPIDNSINGPPTLSLQSAYDGNTFIGQVPIAVTLEDEESDAAIVQVLYSIDGGANFAPATLVNQFVQSVAGPFLTNPSPTPYQMVWDALADFGAAVTETNVVLSLQPKDANDGTVTLTDAFTVISNEAPEVLDVEVLQDSGNVPVVVNIFDENSHPISIDIDYTTNINAGTVTWVPLSVTDFVFGNPTSLVSSPFGEDNVLVWDTNIAFPNTNEAAVVLRITPTDDPLSGVGAAQLTGSTFITAPFPIINDAAGSTPISIDIFTTDNAQNPLANDVVTVVAGGTVYLDRLINPSTAVGFETFWKILETGADYGTLLNPNTGTALQYGSGTVTVSAPGSIVDGDTFTIDDGLNGPQVFEFDTNAVSTIGNVAVDISTASTADDTGIALADAINANPFVRITAAHVSGGVINLTHRVAARLCNEAGADPGRGNATAMSFTGTSGVATGGGQMDGGDGTAWVRYDAPTTPPAGTDFVTLICEIDHPSFWTTVTRSYKLFWGEQPTSIDIQSPVTETLVGTQVQLTSQVFPTGAPQFVDWEVLGGNVNGTISDTGLYTAPSSVPAANPITIRGFCVDPSISPDTVNITIQPYPSGVTVNPPADNPPDWIDPELRLGAAIQFNETVSPANAPQGVNWRIFWNGADQGSGNSTVGTVDATGFYTAPTTLPSPDTVTIEAVSQVLSSVFGGYTIDLVAPPPTSFTVSPTSATVFAGGAGQQFTTGNFSPSNANTSVSWEMNPAPGPTTGSVSQTGFYTPPATTSTAQTITITARSTVAPAVTASGTVDLQPNQAAAPTGVTISPSEGITISASQFTQPIQFSAVVSPAQASQAVNWTIVSGTNGNIGFNTGLFTPDPTTTDELVTIRAEAVADPFIFDEVDICITGDGHSWTEQNNFSMGRGDASTCWDSLNDRLWIIGGRSETSGTDHELEQIWVDFTSTPEFGSYPPISGQSGLSKAPSTVMGVFDDNSNFLYAVVGQGPTSDVKLFRLDATKVDPPGSPPEPWVAVTFPPGGNVPKLGGTNRYHCWWDPIDLQIQLLFGNHTVYRFDTNPVSASSGTWLSPVNLQSLNVAPANPQITDHAFDDVNRSHYFVGAEDGSTGAGNFVWRVDRSSWKWTRLNQQGSPPNKGLINPSMYFHADKLYVFGGREVDKAGFNDDVYVVSFGGNSATWTPYIYTEERPLPRGDAAFALAGFNGAYLYGGELPGFGSYGDLWFFDEGTGIFTPENADNIRPQGRKSATGAYMTGEGLVYGGLCDFGVSNETWVVNFNGAKGGGDWIKISANGDLPPELWGAASCYHEFEDVFIMYGGDENRPGGASDLEETYWSFDPNSDTWTDLGTGPGKRREAAMCFDSLNDRVWVFGGLDDSGNKLNDLWYLDTSGGLPGTWVQVTGSSGSPPDPRVNATIGFDTRSNRLLVCGGDSSVSGPNRQLFTFSVAGNSWTSLSIQNTGQEENVNMSAAIYDDECRRFVHAPITRKQLHGIVMGSNGPTWQYMSPPPLFNNATGSTGLYDPSTGRYYALFGEKTILGRAVGTNSFRSVLLK